jgi:L-lactate dehydrogenase complex protein LldG
MVRRSSGTPAREAVIPVDVEEGTVMRGVEYGDRHAFLARATTFAARDAAPNVAHPLPSERAGDDGFVAIGYRTLTAGLGVLADDFERNATAVMLEVARCGVAGPTSEQLAVFVEEHGVRTAVASRAAAAIAVGAQLSALGVDVADYTPAGAVLADLGVTSPRFGIAATGSLVQDSTLEGSRGASLVPRVHLAVLSVDRIVATTADVLRAYLPPAAMPTNLTFITGPSRTGDIEMILTVGVHGPIKVVIALCG